MPRVTRTEIFRHAIRADPLIYKLLTVCRTVNSAKNELRWLREHAKKDGNDSSLKGFVRRRSRGEPIQYIIGSEFFGDLEIRCREGALIPRQETAASVSFLVQRLCQHGNQTKLPKSLRVLDLCTGTGCIPLLFRHDFYNYPDNQNISLQLTGVDVSSAALMIANENARIHSHPTEQRGRSALSLLEADILRSQPKTHAGQSASLRQALAPSFEMEANPESLAFDIMISNPPYIAPKSYQDLSPSVKRFEPREALTPTMCLPPIAGGVPGYPHRHPLFPGKEIRVEDAFYPYILDAASYLQCKILLVEIGDLEQARLVIDLLATQGIFDTVEIWRDLPDRPPELKSDHITMAGKRVALLGSGKPRSVFAYRGIVVV